MECAHIRCTCRLQQAVNIIVSTYLGHDRYMPAYSDSWLALTSYGEIFHLPRLMSVSLNLTNASKKSSESFEPSLVFLPCRLTGPADVLEAPHFVCENYGNNEMCCQVFFVSWFVAALSYPKWTNDSHPNPPIQLGPHNVNDNGSVAAWSRVDDIHHTPDGLPIKNIC